MKTRNNKIKNRRNKRNTKKFRGGAVLEQPEDPIKTKTKNKSTKPSVYNRIKSFRPWSRSNNPKIAPEKPADETDVQTDVQTDVDTSDNSSNKPIDETGGETEFIQIPGENEPGSTESGFDSRAIDINNPLSMEGIDTKNQENLKPELEGIPTNSDEPSATVIGEAVPASVAGNPPDAPTAQLTIPVQGKSMTEGKSGCPQIVECAKKAIEVIQNCKGASEEPGESKNLEAEEGADTTVPEATGGKKKNKKKRRNTRKPKRGTKKRKSRRRISKKRKNRKH